MNRKLYYVLFVKLFLLSLFLPLAVFGVEIDPTLKKLDLSGFLRMRGWYTSSYIKVPDKFAATDDYKSVNYQDLFFRNRFYLKVLPNLEIRAVFDIFAIMGKDDFAIGNGSTNLVTRDVYVLFKPSDASELTIGLMPFSLPGGYILARDGTGIQYSRHFLKRKIKIFASLLKAYDDANDRYGEDYDPPEYADDNVYIIGSKINFTQNLSTNLYYVHERDRYTKLNSSSTAWIDGRQCSLNWIGIHNKLSIDNWMFSIGGIYNQGIIWNKTDLYFSNYINTKAGLFEFETTYLFNDIKISIVAEGASGDPDNPDDPKSFQDIKASHGFSYIAVDNTGGLAIRGSGESSLYGLYGGGLKLQLSLLDILFEMKLLHFRSTKERRWRDESSTWFGDEFNIKAEYIYQEVVSIFMTGAVFYPQVAYKAMDNVKHDPGGTINEVMLGAAVTY